MPEETLALLLTAAVAAIMAVLVHLLAAEIQTTGRAVVAVLEVLAVMLRPA
jgi:archaellum component FlaG (FlaF/FlaG flagellin family)